MLSADLKELGVTQDSLHYWCMQNRDREVATFKLIGQEGKMFSDNDFAAFTVSELAALIPSKAMIPQSTTLGRWWRQSTLEVHMDERDKGNHFWVVAYIQPNSREAVVSFRNRSMAEAFGEMLCWILENELIPKP